MSGSTDSRRRTLMVAPQRFFRTTGTPMNVLLKCRAVTERLLSAYQTMLADGRPEAATVATGGPPIHG